jgi:outer membrane lipoprotein-sorting protein
MSAQDVLERLSARADTVRTLTTSGRVLVTQGGARFEARHRMLYQRPGLLRVDVEAKPLFGLFAAEMVALVDGDSLHVYSPTHGIVFETSGTGDLNALGPELKWVAIEGIREVLLGMPPLGGRAIAQDEVRPGQDGKYEIPVDVDSGTRSLWVDPETLLVERMDIRDEEGRLVVSSAYEYRNGHSLVPRRVKIQYPANDATISLTYREYAVNGDLDPADFELEIPAGARRFRPGE